MTQSKKYEYRVSQDKKTWTAEIVRRVTSKRSSVSKSQDGFATEAEAKAWGEKELAAFLANLGERNKRDSEQRTVAQKENAAQEAANKQRKQDLESAAAKSADPDDADGSDDSGSESESESGSESGSEFSAWKKSGWDKPG